MPDENQREQEIKATNPTDDRVKPETLDEVIVAEQYHVFEGTSLTVCALTLKNGFIVVGESACADPANFNKEIGENIARDNARQKIWALEGYLLRQKLYEAK